MQISGSEILTGSSIVLTPMEESHRDELRKALHHPEIWEYTWRKISSEKDLDEIISLALEQKKQGTHIPFTILEKESGKVIGTTRLGDIDVTNRNLEIGWTWLTPAHWRTRVNTECKYLLLQYCFEQAKAIRVQFSVSGHNERSQKALERIGAKKEGVFRKHRIKADGSVHDNVFYSILDTEWSEVREKLKHLLERK
ncbi:GNAT family N-acetyltransferase [Brevibacillus nitrificans]|uniref:GNAT family N-acetyltransferase n=1 Tax=Brevibacillus nitrificans TaxID=651560 RepID=UPI00260F9B3A|nr:GNAT family protein [Brevibacillus nitrificans]MED1793179.1 GNAT family protein [Brevibacillus nitrificans]